MYMWRLQHFRIFWHPPPTPCLQFHATYCDELPSYICFWGTHLPPGKEFRVRRLQQNAYPGLTQKTGRVALHINHPVWVWHTWEREGGWKMQLNLFLQPNPYFEFCCNRRTQNSQPAYPPPCADCRHHMYMPPNLTLSQLTQFRSSPWNEILAFRERSRLAVSGFRPPVLLRRRISIHSEISPSFRQHLHWALISGMSD